MTRHEIQQLRERWSSSQTKRINELLAAGHVDRIDAPQVMANGVAMVDLRGITLDQPIHDHHLKRIDFSWCVADIFGQFVNTEIVECRFIGAALDHTNFGDQCVSCDFTDAALKVLRGSFQDCLFVRANMTKASGTEVRFVRCDFSEGNWRKAQFYYSTFDHCVWKDCKFRSGSFGYSRFIGTGPEVGALGNTIMGDVTFE